MTTPRILRLAHTIVRVGWFLRWAVACLMYVLAVTPRTGIDWDWFVVG